jgi:cbb3-type cytochrome oxidase subunit 3
MRLSDALRDLGADGFGQIALLLFFAAFVLLARHAYSSKRKDEHERMSRLPLED